MIKLLLSITIWLRKYQGRGGNYYTISNATAILIVFTYGLFYSLSDLAGKLLNFQNNYVTASPLVLYVVILIGLILNLSLIQRLKRGRIHLKYIEHRFNLIMFSVIGLFVLAQFLAMSL